MTDVQIEDAGSIVLIRPLTDGGRNWVGQNIQAESWQKFGGAIAAEPRTVQAVIEGMKEDGLEVACV